jgi:hypothetical protein
MAISYQQMQLALRSKLLELEVCTTGSVSLTATATGYSRSSGSFISDGFVPGQEVYGIGFTSDANNAAKTLTAVTTTTLSCAGTVAETAGNRTIKVVLPTGRAWENVEFEPTVGEPYVVEQFIPGGTTQFAVGPNGWMEAQVLYQVQIHVPAKYGISAANSYTDALCTLFSPRTAMTLTNGDTLRVRADTGPYRGQLLSRDPGWATVPFTAPLRLYTQNPT